MARFRHRVVNVPLTLPEGPRLTAASPRPARRLPRKHRLMLLLAFEILVFGAGQAHLNPVKRGVVVDVSTTPNHVVT
ncbi:hypothetical protein DK427_21890 [Methylobacterium radiodurans]|uniref:Uncharacterized protein n=1 Tax=Methylobacterium radiodurans TaxID=2202828 RepID=A0A2U8W0Z3_9HYPH|nr:hypothetical protein DK427_21890 [Methylobacterium radiodurans]